MKRSLIVIFLVVLLATSFVQASAWDWWSSSGSNNSNSGWGQGQPLWPDLNLPQQPSQPQPQPEPEPNPNPNPPINPGQPILPTQPSSPGNQVPRPNPSLSADEQNLINQVNQERIKNGLNALQIDYGLVGLAKEKSYDLAVNNYFDHVSPTLGTVYTMLDRAGITYSRAGENIARTGNVARAHSLFMNSAGHRVNVLHAGYTHIGVGIVKRGTSYNITQIFIKK